ncbi:MAG: DNA mismatch repair protein MutS, partial [Verrucomicrobiota bacterium]|nr:DNA mismatch repair protein MutS [Verrucomicrobiota bacterium]
EKEIFPQCPQKILWTSLDEWIFDLDNCRDLLLRHFGVSSLDGFGCRGMESAIASAGAGLYYTQNNLRKSADHITSLSTYNNLDYMLLDKISQRNLELIEPIFSDAKDATLLSVLDQTKTPMGKRLMRDWIVRPLISAKKINQRLDAVQAFYDDQLLLVEITEALGGIRDLERTITRLNVGSANARDLVALEKGLSNVPDVKDILDQMDIEFILEQKKFLCDLSPTTDLIQNAITDEPPLTIKDGGIIRGGYNEQLDELMSATKEGKKWVADLQAQEREKTGIKNLKVKFNKVFGYYLEVTNSNKEFVPETYIRKQTLVNCERYITPELKEIENKILGAEEKSKALEYELFQEIRSKAIKETTAIQKMAAALGRVDVIASLARIALDYHYCRPNVNDGKTINIKDGRHPVVDRIIGQEEFVPNDSLLDCSENQLSIITGPNMAGKSTYIRQVALIATMAQMGSFVPAKEAEIGIADKVFTRVGAADDISRGQSTFMVEMTEAANILNNATEKSLIVLDEIGRGTSTFDGLSLAWSIAEYLHDTPGKQARTLFATHYHELVDLERTMKGVKNYNVAVKEWRDKIIFLRKIHPGGTDKSYGVHVARLAGLPASVIDRAKEILSNLENNELNEVGQPKFSKRTKKSESTEISKSSKNVSRDKTVPPHKISEPAEVPEKDKPKQLYFEF